MEKGKTKKIAMFGGTFNPVHQAHLFLAREFQKLLGLDRVLLVPANIPPHKMAKHLATAGQRMEMCRLAAKEPYMTVSSIEVEREGKSYTADTLRELEEQYPDARLYLITGADMFLTLQKWYDYPGIISRAVICAAPRITANLPVLRAQGERIRRDGGMAVVLEKVPPPISSTQIRERIRQGLPCTGYLPKEVEDYIKEHHLYQDGR